MAKAQWFAGREPGVMLKFLRRHASTRKMRLFGCVCGRNVWFGLSETGREVLEVVERYADGEVGEIEREGAFRSLMAYVKKRAVAPPQGQRAGFADAAIGPELVPALLIMADYESLTDARSGRPILGLAEYKHDACDRTRLAARCVALALAVYPTDSSQGVVELLTESLSLVATGLVDRRWGPDLGVDRYSLLAAHETQRALMGEMFVNPFRRTTTDPSWVTSTVTGLAEGIYADRAFDRMPILADALEDAGCDNADILAHCRGDGPHVRGCWVVDLILGKE